MKTVKQRIFLRPTCIYTKNHTRTRALAYFSGIRVRVSYWIAATTTTPCTSEGVEERRRAVRSNFGVECVSLDSSPRSRACTPPPGRDRPDQFQVPLCTPYPPRVRERARCDYIHQRLEERERGECAGFYALCCGGKSCSAPLVLARSGLKEVLS